MRHLFTIFHKINKEIISIEKKNMSGNMELFYVRLSKTELVIAYMKSYKPFENQRNIKKILEYCVSCTLVANIFAIIVDGREQQMSNDKTYEYDVIIYHNFRKSK